MSYQSSKKGQRGQALILIALGAIGLFAFAALAIDGSRSFSNKRHAQNTADTAALTAALTYIRTSGSDTAKFAAADAAARARATSNGFTNDTITSGPNVKVYIQRCDEVTDLQTGLPLACEGIDTAHEEEYIRVRIVSTIPTTFGRVLGRPTLTAAAEAITRVQGSTSNSSGSGFTGAGMVATNDDPNGHHCFLFNGNATLHTYDSGVFVNCGASDAMFLNGSTVFTMEADSHVVGCKDGNGGYQIVGGHQIICDQTKVPVDASTFASIPTMPTPPACSTNGSWQDSNTRMTPGNWSNVTINNNTVMDPGVYCVSGSFNVNGQNTLSGKPGKVTIVLANGDFKIGASKVFAFDGLEVYTVNSSLDIQGTLTANRLRFYSSGSGTMKINSGSTLKSDNAYFYLHRGGLVWNGNTTVELRAPTTNDPAAGFVVHMPWENTSDLNLNGGSSALLYGTFLAPHSRATMNGGTNFELFGQVIAYNYILDGNGDIKIHYVANSLINPPVVNQPTIELTK